MNEMKPFLILTKNVLFEQPLQNRLQCLGYEVYCSKLLFDKLLHKFDEEQIDRKFAAVIISETISDNEAKQLFLNLSKMSCFIRKTSIEPDEEEQKMIKKIGFYDWISESQSIDRLREYVVHNLVSMNHEKEQARLIFNKEGEVKQDELRAILHVLSKKETAFFEKLLNSNDETVSRTEMSRAIWGDGPNSSQLAQMSIIAKRIRWKLKEMESALVVEAIWGKGYHLKQRNFDDEAV